MIFIVKDEHNEQRDRVRNLLFSLRPCLTFGVDDCKARHEHPYEQTQPKRRERRGCW